MYLKMNIPIKMTFDLVKSDKGYLYYLGTLWVLLVKMAFGLMKGDKRYIILCKYHRGLTIHMQLCWPRYSSYNVQIITLGEE